MASAIADILKKHNVDTSISNITLLSIPRGGLVVADSIASILSNIRYFDIVVPRKLTAPNNKEVSIGAIMDDGTTYVNQELFSILEISNAYFEKEKAYQLEEIKRRRNEYLGNEGSNVTRAVHFKEIENNIILLIDDGIATGSTIIVAARWIRRFRPKLLIIAVPVGPRETLDRLRDEADIVEFFMTPRLSKFMAVGDYYQSFYPITDEEVRTILLRKRVVPK